MPRHAAPLPDALPATFHVAEAAALGVTRGRLAARDLHAPFRGVRASAPAPGASPSATGEGDAGAVLTPDERARRGLLLRIRAHALVLPPSGFYVGDAALALLELPFLDPARAESGDLEIAVVAPHRASRRAGVACIQVRTGLAHTTTRHGVRVATPATAWALLARRLEVRELVRLGDAIVRIPRDDRGRRRPEQQLASLSQLAAAADAGRRLGAERLRTALPLLRTGSMSVLETDWRLNLIGAGLPEPALDVEVRDPTGRLLGISDGAFPEYRLAVEVEGDHHRTSRRQWARDLEKYAAYAAHGWEVVRVASAHIRPVRGVDVGLVRAALLRRGWIP